MKFVLTTDTSCDEYRNVLDELNIPWIPLTYTINSETFDDNFSLDKEYEAFYKKLGNGDMPTTSLITPLSHEEFFERVFNERKTDAIIHLSLSGGLSETANAAKKAADDYMTRHTNKKIYIVDTLSATQGHNMLLYKAVELRDQCLSVEKAYEEIEKLKSRVHAWFMVDNLFHLKRGGRVSGISAAVGTVLNIKPILIINREGKLMVVKKAQGATKTINFFLATIKKYKTDDTSEFYIVQANAQKNAELLKERIEKEYPSARVKIGWLGPIIGTHCGDGMFGVGFIGKDKKELPIRL
jgi:DegV family protein with EDD domain